MSIYTIQNQWGTPPGPWHMGGVFVLGNRPQQNLSSIDISSKDGGKTYQGTISYQGEGKVAFRATQETGVDGNNYKTEIQWGSGGWQYGGEWLIGGREKQRVISINATSDAHGTLNGVMYYAGEGGIAMKATLAPGTAYRVKSTSAGFSVSFPSDSQSDGSFDQDETLSMGGSATLSVGGQGVMVLGTSDTQGPIAMDIKSTDNGKTLSGTMTYDGGSPVSFKGTLNDAALNTYDVVNSKDAGTGTDGGIMVIGSQSAQRVVMLNFTSFNNGFTLEGQIGYADGGTASFSATNQIVPPRQV